METDECNDIFPLRASNGFDMLSKTVMQMSNPDMKTPAAGSPGRG